MEELYRFRQFLAEDKQLKENVEDDFETYYERWEDEFVEGNSFDFDDEDEWEDDIRQPGSKIGDHSWEVSYEEEDDYYEPIINNMLNYLKKNKTYSYKNNDGVNAEFTYDDRGNSIDMSVIYSADDIEKYKNKLNENKKIYKGLINGEDFYEKFSFDPRDLAEGKLYEAINLDIEDDIVYLSGDSGEYEGDIEDGKVGFSVVGYEEEREDGQIDFEDYNWKDILGPKHTFVQISNQIPTKVEADRDYVMITVDLEDLKNLVN